jgi:serine/threonine-protein kinase
MTAILKEDPPELSASGHAVPPALGRIVHRCLEKDPDARFQSASDLSFAIDGISSSSDAISVRERPRNPRARQVALSIIAAAGFIALGALVGRAGFSRETLADVSKVAFEVDTPAATRVLQLALSPDGKYLASIVLQDAVPMLALRPLDRVDQLILDGTDDAAHPFWSPDGQFIGFFAGGTLKRIAVSGGRPHRHLEAAVVSAANASGSVAVAVE